MLKAPLVRSRISHLALPVEWNKCTFLAFFHTFPFERGVMLPCRGVPLRSRNGVLEVMARAVVVAKAWRAGGGGAANASTSRSTAWSLRRCKIRERKLQNANRVRLKKGDVVLTAKLAHVTAACLSSSARVRFTRSSRKHNLLLFEYPPTLVPYFIAAWLLPSSGAFQPQCMSHTPPD